MKRILAFLMANVAVVSLAGLASAAVGPPGVNGPGLAEVGPVAEGLFVWTFGLGLLVVVAVWIGARNSKASDKGSADE